MPATCRSGIGSSRVKTRELAYLQARFSAGLVRPCRVTLARFLKSKNAKIQ